MARLIVLTLLLFAAATPTSAQGPPSGDTLSRRQPATLYELALRDGSRLYGDIVRKDDTEVVFRTQGGATVTVATAEILSLHKVDGIMSDGAFQPADPNATRMFFGPTGRSLKQGQVYLGVYEFLLPFVQVGVTDRISFGGGTPLVFGGDESGRPFWITPKVQVVSREKTQIAVGAFHGFVPGEGSGGIAYAVGTYGNAASSFTVGAGVGYSEDGGRAGVVMIGGEAQVRRNMKLITENYIWEGGHAVVTGGVRFFSERLSADLALALPITEGFYLAPVVNFVRIF